MKTESGRDIQGGVNVVHVMEAPEEWSFVVEEVPIVEAQIEQQESHSELRPARQSKHVNQTDRLGRGPVASGHSGRPDDQHRDEKCHRGNRRIHKQACEQTGARFAKGKELFDREQQRENAEDDGGGVDRKCGKELNL